MLDYTIIAWKSANCDITNILTSDWRNHGLIKWWQQYHAGRKIPLTTRMWERFLVWNEHAGVTTIGKKLDLCFRNQKGNFYKSNAHLFAWQWKIWPNIELIFCILYSHKCVLGLFWLWPTLAGRHLKTNGLIWQWASQPERISHLFYSSHLDVFPAKYINCMIYLDFS